MLKNRILLFTSDTPGYRPGWPALTLVINRLFDSVTITAETVTPPPVWYDWFIDGLYMGRTVINTNTFLVGDDQVQVEVLIARSIDAPVPVRTPAAARRLLWWIRSPDEARWYRIDQQAGETGPYAIGAGWQPVGRVRAVRGQWSHTWLTERLLDLTRYAWRVVPLDDGDNPGTPVVLATERIVRIPDAPRYTASVDPDSLEVTFAAE